MAVDIGNSHISSRLYAGHAVDKHGIPVALERESCSVATKALLADSLFDPPAAALLPMIAEQRLGQAACLWRVASVHRGVERAFGDWVRRCRPQDHYLLLDCSHVAMPARVTHPDRVGIDRLAAALAANRLREARRAAIIVDSGSAVTVDLVSAVGEFLGGTILPGLAMAAAALAAGTDQLPLIVADGLPPSPLGRDTEAAIRSGIFWGTLGAVKEIIAQLKQQQQVVATGQPPQIFVTGGGLVWTDFLEADVLRCPHLVLDGVALAGRSS